jgi:hypothetical protein
MKKLLLYVISSFILLLGMSGIATATIIETVQLDFASGAQYNGTITYNDNYNGMTDTNGYLDGGSYDNIFFSWTWRENDSSEDYPNPGDWNDDGYLDDWLMRDGESVNDSTNLYISLSWDNDGGDIAYAFIDDADYSGVYKTADLMISATSNPVPEPATMLLFGTGLIGLAGVGRKKFFKKN